MKTRFLWRSFKARYWDQAVELAELRRAIRPGDLVADIGAYKGSYLYWLSRWTPRGRVVAFEPQPEVAAYLRSACGELKLANVTVEAQAVHASAGEMTLHIPEGGAPGASVERPESRRKGGTTLRIPVVSLDEYFAGEQRRVAALKIDVEGAELALFQGAERILREHQPLLVFECEQRQLEKHTVEDVFAILHRLGYEGRFICEGRLKPLAKFRAEIHQQRGPGRFWKAKGYCNNFVFAKAA